MKSNTLNKTIALLGLVIFVFAFMAFSLPQNPKKAAPWDIPDEYVEMDNPYADDASLLRVGKMMYNKHCKSCHGNKGLGDGPKAKQMETFPGDFSSEEFQTGTDGEIYYKSIIGREEMPNYEKKIPEEEDR